MEKWKKTCLGEIATEISDRIDNPSKSGYERFVGLEHFVSGDLRIKKWGPTENLVSAMKLFKKGDILFARRNAYLKRASMVDFDGICSGDAFVIRENKDAIIPGFLAFIFNGEQLWQYANSHAAGTMSKRVKWRDLAKYTLLVPPLKEQENIANLLWSINSTIEAYSKISMHLGQLRQSLEWEFFQKRKWKVGRIEEIAQVDYGISESVADNKDSKIGWPIITGANISLEGDIDLSKKVYIEPPKKDQFFLKEGDLLLNWRSGSPAHVGKTAIFDLDGKYTYASFILRIRSNSELFLPEYGFYLFNFLRRTEYFTKDVAQQVNFKMNANVFRSVEVPVPELKEQNRIVKKLDRIVKQKKSIEAFIDRTTEIQKKIINQIFVSKP